MQDSKKEMGKKMLKVSMEIEAIAKDKKNPHFKNSYFDINKLLHEVKPVLIANGLLLTQPIQDGKVFSIITDVDNGQTVKSFLTLPEGIDPQKLGSAITYFRRYTLGSLLAIEAEDDDGNTASQPQTKREDNPITEWLTKEQFETTMKADIQGVRAVINLYNGKSGKGMKKEYRERLTGQLSQLIEEQTMANVDPFESALPE